MQHARLGRCLRHALAPALLVSFLAIVILAQPRAFAPPKVAGLQQASGNHAPAASRGVAAQAAEPSGNSPIENSNYPAAQQGASPNLADLPAFAQQLWDKYQQRLKGPHASNSTVVYMCGGSDLCGGWGDRLRGMATLFYYALLTDSQFDIVNTKPMDLAAVYPLIAERRPAYNQEGAQSVQWIDVGMDFFLTRDLKAEAQQHPVHAIRCNGFGWHYPRRNPLLSNVTAFYQLDRLTTLDLFRVMMELYFSRPSPELQALVDAELAQMTLGGERPYRVGVQIRNGGSWGDGIRHPTESARQFADQSLDDCKQAGGSKCWVYVTSDSQPAQDLFLQHIKEQRPGIHVTGAPGAPVHVDRSSIAASDSSALLKSYVDWELLRHMDHLVVSRSGFGETAAWTAAIPAERINSTTSTFFSYDTVIGPLPGVHP